MGLGKCGCRKKEYDESDFHSRSPDVAIQVLRKYRSWRGGQRGQLRVFMNLVKSHSSHCGNRSQRNARQCPKTTTRKSQMEIDHIAVEHRCDLWIVMQLHAEGLVVDAHDSASERGSILQLNTGPATHAAFEQARTNNLRS